MKSIYASTRSEAFAPPSRLPKVQAHLGLQRPKEICNRFTERPSNSLLCILPVVQEEREIAGRGDIRHDKYL
jgi:hypothetical protein